MASPSLGLMCCAIEYVKPDSIVPNNGSISELLTTITQAGSQASIDLEYVFNIAVILSSTLSILASVYLFCPKRSYVPVQRRSLRSMERQRKVLTWLSVADLLACVGVLIIGIAGLTELGSSIQQELQQNLAFKWTCIIATAWIQYFYMATYFWTFVYALDVNMMLRGSNKDFLRVYFVLSWGLPFVMVFVGTYLLYYSAQSTLECDTSYQSLKYLLPHYLVSYIPMMIVLVVNPLLYWQSAKRVGPLLMGRGIFTDKERKIKSQVQQKFFFIVLMFTVCWIPNVINGCIILTRVAKGDRMLLKGNIFDSIIWIAMAILNPLQAFFNALIYWGPTGCMRNHQTQNKSEDITYPVRAEHRFMSNNWPDGTESLEETTPLVRNSRATS